VGIGRIIDISSNQHPNNAPINWNQVAGAGVTAAFIKATEGTGYVNPFFQSDMLAAQKAGLLVCGYHFASMGDPVAEAQKFRKVAWRWARMLDYETNTNVAWARTFLQTLGLPADQVITYGSADSLKDFYGQLPSMAFPAAYGQAYPGWGVCWQFTSSATIPGIVGNVDEDQWHGSETQYDLLFQVNAPPGPIVTTPGGRMLAPTPTGSGYWTVNPQGAVITHGDAQYLGGPNTSEVDGKWGGPPVLVAGRAVVSITSHPSQQGYWIEDNIGDVYAYGAARYLPPN
jgi:hypothetical protein